MLGYIISNKEEINVIEHEIQSFDVLHKTDLNIFVIENGMILYKNDIINNASNNGHIQVLEWFKHSGYEFEYDEKAINWASGNGHVQVLEWFKQLGHDFKNNGHAVCYASMTGHVQVLEWFKRLGYKFNHCNLMIFSAAIYGHVQVLKWFKRSGYDLKYCKNTIKKVEDIIILKFFIENIHIKKVIKWSKHAIVKTLKLKTKNKYLKGYKKN